MANRFSFHHRNHQQGRPPARAGQSLVEFALISILLFTLLLGILEMGRLLFIFSQVSSAAQEGTRYGAAHPRQVISTADDGLNAYPAGPWNQQTGGHWGAHNDNPCNIVAAARAKVVLINGHDVDVVVGFDDGSDHPVDFWSASVIPPGTRTVVTATYQFHFMLGLFDSFLPGGGLRVPMVSARTVMGNDDPAADATACTYDPSGAPTPTPVATPSNTPLPTATPAAPACNTISMNLVHASAQQTGNSGKYRVAFRVHLSANGLGQNCACTVTANFAGGPSGVTLQAMGGGDYAATGYCASTFTWSGTPSNATVTATGTIAGCATNVNLTQTYPLPVGSLGTCP